MPPPGNRFDVATEALRSDAREWALWSIGLKNASHIAGALTLTADDFCGLSELVGLPALYSAVQQRAETLAADGARTFMDVANTLVLVARHYDRADANAVRRLTPR